MPPDFNLPIADWTLRVKVKLSGSDLYFANEELALDDGTFWKGRLESFSLIQRSAGSWIDPRVITPEATIVFKNINNEIVDLIAQENWANKDVELSVGYSKQAANYQNVFFAKVRLGGREATDTRVTIQLTDMRSADRRTLPQDLIDSTTYPNAETKSLNHPIPWVFGDFTFAVSTTRVPAYQIDHTVNTGGQFIITGGGLKQHESVFLNDVAATYANVNLDAGTFELTQAYNPATDTITVHCQGRTDTGLSTGTLLQTIPDITQDVLESMMGVASAKLDQTAFDAWDAELTIDDYARGIIGNNAQREDSDEVLARLLFEGFGDMIISGTTGQYTPQFRLGDPAASIPTFRTEDLLDQSDGTKQFREHLDDTGLFANVMTGRFDYNPATLVFDDQYNKQDDASIAQYGLRQDRTLDFYWLHQTGGVQVRTQRELFLFSTEPELVDLGIGPQAAALEPTDRFRLVHGKYSEAQASLFQIRDHLVDYGAMHTRPLVGFNMSVLGAGTWTEDAAVTWLTATDDQRNQKGFLTDANGYADTSGSPSEASRRYKYL